MGILITLVTYRFMMTESYSTPRKLVLYYGTEDKPEADFPFNFQLILLTEDTLSGTEVYNLVDDWMVNTPPGKWPNWVVSIIVPYSCFVLLLLMFFCFFCLFCLCICFLLLCFLLLPFAFQR